MLSDPIKPLSFWEMIFTLSPVNGADNCQDILPVHGRDWPKETFLQRRLEELKQETPK